MTSYQPHCIVGLNTCIELSVHMFRPKMLVQLELIAWCCGCEWVNTQIKKLSSTLDSSGCIVVVGLYTVYRAGRLIRSSVLILTTGGIRFVTTCHRSSHASLPFVANFLVSYSRVLTDFRTNMLLAMWSNILYAHKAQPSISTTLQL